MPPTSGATRHVAARRAVHATIELGELLHQYQLELVLVAGVDDETPGRPVQWVHASELQDPTPFLTPRTVLLTTGARLSHWETQAEADAYVGRLLDAEATALGVAVGLHWERVPTILVAACDRLGLPLFRVPYDTSFIAIVQTAAHLLDARTHERDLWALSAQRAVSGAALRRDGLEAAVREAAAQLGRWVALTDRAGRIVEFAPRDARRSIDADWIRREARTLVERGTRGGSVRVRGGAEIQLQTLGGTGHLLGVLVAESDGAPDHAEQTLIGLVAALATVQLEHRSGVAASESALRGSVVELLAAGLPDLAERVSRGVLTRLPRGRVAVIRFDSATAADGRFADDLRSLDGGSQALLLAAPDERELIVCEAGDLLAARRLLQAYAVTAGVSERADVSELARLLDQAELAFERAGRAADPTARLVDYSPAIHSGVLSLLDDSPEAAGRAETLLAPIRAHDQRHDDRIEESLRVWLGHHGQTSPAATELGVHRHTLRSRVQTAANLLQSDLDSPDTRAEVWAALRLAR